MAELYIALVSTPGIFASVIRRVIEGDYVHVVLSLDARMEEAYSVGRRNPFIPILAGFVREDLQKIARKYPMARYKIMRLTCTEEQRQSVIFLLHRYHECRRMIHYSIIGLPFILLNKPFYQKRYYTCSSFTARVLEENRIYFFGKHFSLVTPFDFYSLKDVVTIFEGDIQELLKLCADASEELAIRKEEGV